MQLVIARPLIRSVAARWKAQYFHDGKWYAKRDKIYERLLMLDIETAEPADVAKIIGNRSWSEFFCTNCNEYYPRAISLDGGDYTTYICERCLRLGLELISPAAAHAGEQKDG